jgi:hypothetical protein
MLRATPTKKNQPDSGMFRYEADLVAHLLGLLPGYVGGRAPNWRVAVEVNVGSRIADVVVATWHGNMLWRPRALSIRECVVLAALRQAGTIQVDALEYRCGLRNGEFLARDLDRLIAEGLVRKGRYGLLSAAERWADRIRLMAIEAKLEEWRKALSQAQVYAHYADVAYVAMPAGHSHANMTEAFSSKRVGLLSIGTESIHEHVPARRFVRHGWRREFALSRVLTFGKSNQTAND